MFNVYYTYESRNPEIAFDRGASDYSINFDTKRETYEYIKRVVARAEDADMLIDLVVYDCSQATAANQYAAPQIYRVTN